MGPDETREKFRQMLHGNRPFEGEFSLEKAPPRCLVLLARVYMKSASFQTTMGSTARKRLAQVVAELTSRGLAHMLPGPGGAA